MRNSLLLAFVLSASVVSRAASQGTASAASASPDTSVTVALGAFVDTYYAYDLAEPLAIDRAFTTQAARHNEFNVNLAHVEAKLTGQRVRGRLALQAGTSVQSNYSGEPTVGTVSGPSLSRVIQEAVAGYQLTSSLWVDGGIFFSHIGMESFISRDNLTYTRSLSAEYTPYYESGAKLTWQANPRVAGTLVVMNGWQNISENNHQKSVGLRVDVAASPVMTLSYYNYLGRENASGLQRIFNGIGFKMTLPGGFALQANGDYGIQDRDGGGQSKWYSAGVIGRVQAAPNVAVSGRVERYHDPDQVIIVTGTDDGFGGTVASIGLDVMPLRSSRMMWRSELRATWDHDPSFPSRSEGLSKDDYLIVTSLALTF